MRELKAVRFDGDVLRIIYEDEDGLHDTRLLMGDVSAPRGPGRRDAAGDTHTHGRDPERHGPPERRRAWREPPDARVLVCRECLLERNVVLFRVAADDERDGDDACPRCGASLKIGEAWSRENAIYRIRLDVLPDPVNEAEDLRWTESDPA